ncbi:hypothetical protein Tco_0787263 [Tanacetum coccineum]
MKHCRSPSVVMNLGIESYQTQLNLTKPRWDATGFEFKHDYTVIDSPRAVTFRDRYGSQQDKSRDEYKILDEERRCQKQGVHVRYPETAKDTTYLPESGELCWWTDSRRRLPVTEENRMRGIKEGIMLGHKVSEAGLEVNKAKIKVIYKLPPPTNIKGIRSFLGHASFYRRFIKDFSKIARPLTKLLEKDTLFERNEECHNAFKLLKEKLTCAPVIILLLQEFDIEIKDRKGTENVAADHLSQIKNDETSDDSEVDDNFPEETLMEIDTKDDSWFADFANYLNCHLPFKFEHHAYWALKNCNPDLIAAGEKRMFQLHKLDELRHQTYETLPKSGMTGNSK